MRSWRALFVRQVIGAVAFGAWRLAAFFAPTDLLNGRGS
jgi:hypothetical protein